MKKRPKLPKLLGPFSGHDAPPDVSCLVAMMYARYPVSVPNVKDLLHERRSETPLYG